MSGNDALQMLGSLFVFYLSFCEYFCLICFEQECFLMKIFNFWRGEDQKWHGSMLLISGQYKVMYKNTWYLVGDIVKLFTVWR